MFESKLHQYAESPRAARVCVSSNLQVPLADTPLADASQLSDLSGVGFAVLADGWLLGFAGFCGAGVWWRIRSNFLDCSGLSRWLMRSLALSCTSFIALKRSTAENDGFLWTSSNSDWRRSRITFTMPCWVASRLRRAVRILS